MSDDPSTVPEIDSEAYSVGQIMTEILIGEIALPVWIKFGRTRHKITAENKAGVCQGLLIALELQSAKSE